MSMSQRQEKARGFTMLEMMVAMGIFLVICGAMFELLQLSQKKYSSETQLSAAYQDARLAIDQIVRDVSVAGYPPVSVYTGVAPAPFSQFAISPVAWSPNYGTSPCTVIAGGGGTCSTPGDYDLIVETRLAGDSFVSWVWYHLDTTKFTLYREVVPKTSGDPLAAVTSAGTMVPLLENVMNNPGGQLAQITANFPAMFPGGGPQPLFQYSCDTPPGPAPCGQAGAYNASNNIRDVDVTLIVKTPQQDMQTESMKLVELNGRGHRLNP
jgi:prepilin-type N-terminal cleavage/methylation domain-containing protein